MEKEAVEVIDALCRRAISKATPIKARLLCLNLIKYGSDDSCCDPCVGATPEKLADWVKDETRLTHACAMLVDVGKALFEQHVDSRVGFTTNTTLDAVNVVLTGPWTALMERVYVVQAQNVEDFA